jgi:hypothetical protein
LELALSDEAGGADGVETQIETIRQLNDALDHAARLAPRTQRQG